MQMCVSALIVLQGHLSADDEDERRWFDEYIGMEQGRA